MCVLEVAWEHTIAGTVDTSREDALKTLNSYMDKPEFAEWWDKNRGGFLKPWQQVVDEAFNTTNSDSELQ